MANRTPLPWKSNEDSCSIGIYMLDKDGSCGPQVAMVLTENLLSDNFDQARNDADFIVRACNAHDDLLNALEDVLSVLHGKSSGTPEQNLAALESVVASALLKAKEPPHGAP